MSRYEVSLWLTEEACYNDVQRVVDATDGKEAIERVMQMRHIRYARFAAVHPADETLPIVNYEHVYSVVSPAIVHHEVAVEGVLYDGLLAGWPDETCEVPPPGSLVFLS